MMRIIDKLDKLFVFVIIGLFGIFVTYLTLLSLFSTNLCFTNHPQVFISDSPVKAIIGYVVLIVLICIGREKGLGSWISKHHRGLKQIGNVLLALFLIFFITATNVEPHGDQLAITNAAVGLSKYDFSLFANKSYFVYWPFQSRIVAFLWGFFQIFGNYNYFALHLLNAICIMISLNLLAHISAKLLFHADKGMETIVFYVSCLFWPFLFYVTFIYGNLIGFAFIMGAIYALIEYHEKGRYRLLFLAVILCAIGVWLKNTYQIMMIAMVILLAVEGLSKRKIANIVAIIAIVITGTSIGKISDAVIENRMGFPLSEGTPMIAWVTMAFGENESGNPVTFDGYNISVYLDNDLDYDRANKAATEELKARLAKITDTPEHFIRFMGKKIALEWNDPSYESIVANVHQIPQKEWPDSIKFMLKENSNNSFLKFANLYQALVLLGALSWAMFAFKKRAEMDLFLLLFPLIFVGGFLFQLFWETISQYTLLYALMLIPFACAGYYGVAQDVSQLVKQKKLSVKMMIPYATFLLVIVCMSFISVVWIHDLFRLDYDNESYAQALGAEQQAEAENEALLADGEYRLTPAFMEGYGIALATEDKEVDHPSLALVSLDETGEGIVDSAVDVYHEYGYDFLRLKSNQMLFSLEAVPESGNANFGLDYDLISWKLVKVNDIGYAITYEKQYALTASKDGIVLAPYTGLGDQIWKFEKR